MVNRGKLSGNVPVALLIAIPVHISVIYPLAHTATIDKPGEKKPFKNIVGKGENAGLQHFLLFPQFFYPCPKQLSALHLYLFCRLQMLSVWTSQTFC